ncbi:MAG: septum formation initiator family protein [Geminicoccaceae bacterium]
MLRNLSGALIEPLKGRWLSIAVTLVLVYFGYHAVHGRYGLLAWMDTSRDLAAAEEQLAALVDQRERLETDVAAFQPDSLDRDRLEEQLRLLGYVRPNEVVVLRRDEAPAR